MALRIHLPRRWAEGETVVLPPAESRHVQVLRKQPGDAVLLFNGDDAFEWPAEIVRIGRSEVELRIVGAAREVERELAVAVTLAIGIPANERMDALVEKATELGAAAIQPLLCERSVVRLAGDRAEARQRHWQAVAASASEQCGRTRVPRVASPARFDAWLGEMGGASEAAGLPARWVLSLAAAARRPAALHDPAREETPAGLVVLSGPEGGLSPDEEAAALRHGFVSVSLGARVLRADTAPLALLAWLGLADRRRRE
ncbi:MAG: 16S rRNA (uracil(1498)-N(3))-methyltransferase [Burkholderiales bacterium]|nr:16S rRNA (uracil(1498)-N(3))-methyltransferase [Burkholderiales bacterium]